MTVHLLQGRRGLWLAEALPGPREELLEALALGLVGEDQGALRGPTGSGGSPGGRG